MKIKIPGKTAEETKAIVLEEIRLTSDGIEAREQRIVGNYFFFVLRMRRCTPTRKAERENDRHVDMMYRKRNWTNERWTGAVCFHGHKIFMQRLFYWYPDAIVRTAKAAYLGRADFNDKWPRVADANVGSQMMPASYADCCECMDDLDYPADFQPVEVRP